jgi:hypothetical protein
MIRLAEAAGISGAAVRVYFGTRIVLQARKTISTPDSLPVTPENVRRE